MVPTSVGFAELEMDTSCSLCVRVFSALQCVQCGWVGGWEGVVRWQLAVENQISYGVTRQR